MLGLKTQQTMPLKSRLSVISQGLVTASCTFSIFHCVYKRLRLLELPPVPITNSLASSNPYSLVYLFPQLPLLVTP